MTEEPKFSIVTICLNADETIQRTIDSVRCQCYPNLEYFVVDGGSTDRTIDVLTRNSDDIDGFTSEQDDGIADAFNKGIRQGTGELIGIINADDWYEPNVLDRIANAYSQLPAKKRERTIFHGNLNFVSGVKTTLVAPRMRSNSLNHWSFYFDMPVHHPTCFVPRKLYDSIGEFDTSFSIAMDFDFILRARNFGAEFFYIPSTISNFSIGGASARQTRLAIQEVRRAQRKHGLAYLPCQTSFAAKYIVNRMKYLMGMS